MIRIYDWGPDAANHVCVMHDTFTWLMVTSDVCARLLKQRLVVPKTAPLAETNRALVFRESMRDENLYPAHRSSSALGVGKDKFKAHGAPIFFFFWLTDKQFLIQETLPYICMGSVWYRAPYACVESTEPRSRAADVQFIRSQAHKRMHALDAKWPDATLEDLSNLNLYSGLHAPQWGRVASLHSMSLHALAT